MVKNSGNHMDLTRIYWNTDDLIVRIGDILAFHFRAVRHNCNRLWRFPKEKRSKGEASDDTPTKAS